MAPSSDDDDLLPNRELYSIPSSSSWFRWDEIHEEERKALPEFFQGASASRNPRIYKEYRDFIINKYREDPARRLTFTEVRKSLIGDVGHLHKVFDFLERAGLINFSAEGKEKPRLNADGPKVVIEEGAPVGIQVVPALAPTKKRAAPAPAAGGGGEGAGSVGGGGLKLPPLTSYSDVFGDSVLQRSPFCGFCGDLCAERGYAFMKDGLVVCSKCKTEKSQLEIQTTGDLDNQVEPGPKPPASPWTDSETLLLLEAVLKHGDDWDLIAQHVRTKTKVDCIARLIHLPFAEHILGTITSKVDSKNAINQAPDVKKVQLTTNEPSGEPIKRYDDKKMDYLMVDDNYVPVGPSKKRRFPSLLYATGSLMEQVARLSSIAGPHVMEAANEAAITAMCKENPCAQMVFDASDQERRILSANDGSNSYLEVEDWSKEAHKQNVRPDAGLENTLGADALKLKAAVATTMGAAAARAKLLADNEDREIGILVASIIDAQLRKMRLKIKHLEELEIIMEKEYTFIQDVKESVLVEWIKVLDQAIQAGVPRCGEGETKPFLNNCTL